MKKIQTFIFGGVLLLTFPILAQVDVPKDFPVKQDTGRPEEDEAVYLKAKAEWIAKNATTLTNQADFEYNSSLPIKTINKLPNLASKYILVGYTIEEKDNLREDYTKLAKLTKQYLNEYLCGVSTFTQQDSLIFHLQTASKVISFMIKKDNEGYVVYDIINSQPQSKLVFDEANEKISFDINYEGELVHRFVFQKKERYDKESIQPEPKLNPNKEYQD